MIGSSWRSCRRRPVLSATIWKKFDFEEAKRVVSLFLTELLEFSEQEKRFVEEFNVGHYTPNLLFDDTTIIERVESHPMALWKIQHLVKK